MPDKEQAGTSNVEDTGSNQVTALETASDSVEQEKDRIADLTARLEKKGRTEKSLAKELAEAKAALAAKEEREAKLLKANAEWQETYIQKWAPPEEKAQYMAKKAAENRISAGSSVNEAAFWRSVAEEEDPKVKGALAKIAASASRTKRYPDAETVKAIRESLRGETSEDDKDDEKPLAKVTPTAGAQAGQGTLQSKYEAAKKAKDFDEMFRISSQIEAAKLRASRA
jgi:hypothetical protein